MLMNWFKQREARKQLRAMARRKAAFVFAKRNRKLVPISTGQVLTMAEHAPAAGWSNAPTELLAGLSRFQKGGN